MQLQLDVKFVHFAKFSCVFWGRAKMSCPTKLIELIYTPMVTQKKTDQNHAVKQKLNI